MSVAESTRDDARCRVLIVEDDAAIRRLVTKLLLRRSIDVDQAVDGTEAMGFLELRQYDAIVLDLMLPGIDGFEIVERIKEKKLRTPVAVVSAVSNQALARLDLDIVKIVISKPFDVDEFTKAVVALCENADE